MNEYEELREAGFSDSEIEEQFTKELTEGGFTEPEIKQWLYEQSGRALKAYQGEEVESVKALAEVAAQDVKEDEPNEVTFKRAIEIGWQNSVSGMLKRGKMPDELTDEEIASMSFMDRTVASVAGIVSDIPVFWAGGKLGAKAGSFVPGNAKPFAMALSSSAAAFGVHAAARQILVDAYSRGEVMSAEELMYRVGNTFRETLKGGVVGATMGVFGIGGKAAGGALKKTAAGIASPAAKKTAEAAAKTVAPAAEIFGLTTASAGVEGRIPTAQDFLDSAAAIGVLKLGYKGLDKAQKLTLTEMNNLKKHVLPKLYQRFVKTGQSPAEAVLEAAEDPLKMQKLLGIESIKKGYEATKADPTGGTPLDEMARFLKNYIIERGAAIQNENGDYVVQGRELFRKKGTNSNFGFTKAIFKHGLTADEMAKLYDIINLYEPEVSGNRSRILVPGEKEDIQIALQKKEADQRLVTMYKRPKEENAVYSKKREIPLDAQQKRSVPTERQDFESLTEQSTSGDYYFVPDGERFNNNNVATKKFPVNLNEAAMPESGIIEDIAKLSDAVQKIKDKIGVPVRMGKVRGGKNVLGQYYPNEKMIRTRFANDIETVAHEAGHHIENIVFGGIGSKEAMPFYDELSAIASKPKKDTKAMRNAEGVAEFVSAYVVNPELAKEKCPKFFEKFEAKMKEDAPELLETLRESQAIVRRWVEQPAVARVMSRIAFDIQKQKITLKEKAARAYDWFAENIADDLYQVGKVSEKLSVDPEDGRSPYFRARMLRGLPEAKTKYTLTERQIDFHGNDIGESLKEILKPVKRKWFGLKKGDLDIRELNTYLEAKHAIEREAAGKTTGNIVEDLIETVEALEPKYKPIAEKIWRFEKNNLKILRDSGLISDEQYKNIDEAYQFYVPLNRVMENDFAYGMGVKKLQGKNPLKKAKGSTRDIIPPIESIVKNTIQIIGNAEKNRVALAIADLANAEGSGEFVFKVPNNMEKISVPLKIENGEIEYGEVWRQSNKINERNQVSAYRGGRLETYEVAPELAAVVNNLDAQNAIWIMQTAGMISKSLRAGATSYNATFALKNLVRDTIMASLTTKGEYGWRKIPATAWAMYKQKPVYKAYLKSGTSMVTFQETERPSLQKTIKDLTSTGYFDDLWNCVSQKQFGKAVEKGLVTPVLDALAFVGNKSEQLTRFGVFRAEMLKMAREAGKPVEEMFTQENIERAGFKAREATLDFAKGGVVSKQMNVMTAFFNANVLGNFKNAEVLRKSPVRAVTYLGLLGFVNALANWDWEEWDVKMQIQEEPKINRDTNYVFPIGEEFNFRIPKAQQLGFISTVFEQATYKALSAYEGKERDGIINELAQSFWAELSITPIPNIVLTPFEVAANYSLFSGKPIVPRSQEDILADYQYLEQTTETAKAFSRATAFVLGDDNAVSPIKLEYFLRGWTGQAGTAVLRSIDWAGKKAGIWEDKAPAKKLNQMPFFRAFVSRYPQKNAESVARFYQNADKAEKYIGTLRIEEKRRNFDTIKNRAYWSAYETMIDYKKTILELTAAAFEIQQSDMNKNEKRVMLDEIYRGIIDTAREGNELFKEIEKIVEKYEQ